MRRQAYIYSLIVIVVAAIFFYSNKSQITYLLGETNISDSAIHVMNVDGSNVKRLTDYGNAGEALWSPDGSKISFIYGPRFNYTSALYVVDADGFNKIKLSGGVSGSVGEIDWSPDGNQIVYTTSYFFRNDRQDVYIVNVDGTSLKQLTVNEEVYWPSWSPDGSKIAFMSISSGRHELYTMSTDGSNITQLTDFSSYRVNLLHSFCWSRDGSKIAFSV